MSLAGEDVQHAGTAPVAASAAEAWPTPVQSHGPLFGAVHRQAAPTFKYLMTTEVHTYAFSVAANAILSFFPAIVLLLTITRRVFHSQTMYEVVLGLLRDYLPSNQDFVIKNLRVLAAGHTVQVFSIIMLIISSTGIFLPLEVALNKVWGFRKDRSYLGNQIMSLGLAFGCGSLAMLSIGATAANWHLLGQVFGGGILFRALAYFVMKIFSIVASVGIFFLIYWVLPNGKVPPRAVLPAAAVTGLLFEFAKWLYVAALPWLDFQEVYGPFSISVTLMFWAFVSGLMLLGGAYLSAAEHTAQQAPKH
ncbi:MAG TPA: YihY/virulence factor BrkB family protein [Clostridia bacterium]|nr:YihY/virulence factor BrkB family protein [Clostridia bacterium]